MNNKSWLLAPLAVVLTAGFWLVLAMSPPREKSELHLREFGSLPVLEGGRVKPFDTLARTNLMILSGRQTYKDDDGVEHSAVEWLLDVMMLRALNSALLKEIHEAHPEVRLRRFAVADDHKVFRIENAQVLSLLELDHRPGSYRYSYTEIMKRLPQLLLQADSARARDKNSRDQYDVKVLELVGHLELYVTLSYTLFLTDKRNQEFLPKNTQVPLTVPPVAALSLVDTGEWQSFDQSVAPVLAGRGRPNPASEYLFRIALAYASENATEFNRAVDEYRKYADELMPSETGTARLELFFNQFAPFYCAAILYLFVFLLTSLAWIGWAKPLNWSAFGLAALALVVQTWGLCTRMYIQGRPPVTNLYSSAVFIGWGCVAVCLVLEGLYRNGFGNLVAGVTGALTLYIAQFLSERGDTLEMMQAVLDTNIWLATHVVCVTFGYTASFVAGFIGCAYIFFGVATPLLTREPRKKVSDALYGVVCFATLLSFVGTVLGGIWADQSWGRFWGWDPKENGALLIVIMNALILHARWGGLVKQRGVAVLAVVGNMVTGWSWFGTNQLGVGLHSYGFSNALATGLMIFWVLMALFVIAGLLPERLWWSLNTPEPQPPSPEGNAGGKGGKAPRARKGQSPGRTALRPA